MANRGNSEMAFHLCQMPTIRKNHLTQRGRVAFLWCSQALPDHVGESWARVGKSKVARVGKVEKVAHPPKSKVEKVDKVAKVDYSPESEVAESVKSRVSESERYLFLMSSAL